MDTAAQVAHFISELTKESEIDQQENLFETGVLSSLDVLELVVYVEETFGISVAGDELTVENFGSISAISSFVDGARQEQNAPSS